MRIKNLQLRAKAVVDGFYSGLHRSPFHGFSVEFSEYREYSPGDDPRYLDWRLFARSDRYYIKRFEDETNRRCYLVLDLSKSMSYGSLPYSKAEYAQTLAATLAYYLTLQRDNVGLLTFDDTVGDLLPARHRSGHLHQLMVMLQGAPRGQGTDLLGPLDQIARLVVKRGLIVLISDLLAPLDLLDKHLGYLRSRGHEVLILRVLDPTELDFSFDQSATFHDAESERDLYIDPDVARDDYLRRFGQHEQQLKSICAHQGIDLVPMETDTSLEKALVELLWAQTRQGRPSFRQRRVSRAGGGSA
jgi:uncharacterized protein (DUF58 family)